MKIYKCDNKGCKQESDELSSWLTIGSSDEKKLFILNNTYFQGLNEMWRHSAIHFCCAKCFVKFLFGDTVTLVQVEPLTPSIGEETITDKA